MNSNLELWLENPITKAYRKLLKEHRDAHVDRMLNCGVMTPDQLPMLAQIKGQVNALDLMLDLDLLENFISEELEKDAN